MTTSSSTAPAITDRSTWEAYLLSHADAQRGQDGHLGFARQQLEQAYPGLFYLQQLKVVMVSGADAQSFLQGQLSCDMQIISAEHSGIGSHNSLKGRMLSSFRIIKISDSNALNIQAEGDHYALLMDASIVDDCIAALQKYAVFSKVSITHADSLLVLGLQSQEATTVLQRSAAGINDCADFSSAPCIQVDHAATRFLLLCSYQTAAECWSALSKSAHPADSSLWQVEDIRQGLAWVSDKIRDQFLPQAFNYHQLGGLSFKKGCYIGQEVIVRTQHRGKLKRGMFLLQLEAKHPLAVGDALYAEQKPLGECVACAKAGDEYWALAVLQRDFDLQTRQLENADAQSLVLKQAKPMDATVT